MNKHTKLIILVFAFIFLIVLYFLLNNSGEKEKIETPPPQPTYQSLRPGESLERDVEEKLGSPLIKINEADQKILEYQSSSPVNNHQVIVKDGEVVLIKEIVTLADSRNKKQIVGEYGEANYILYGPDADASFYLYVYPEKGIAYIGHTDQDFLIEVWYFEPTTLEGFKSNFAPPYSDEPEIRQ
jgi:hypothetical protein